MIFVAEGHTFASLLYVGLTLDEANHLKLNQYITSFVCMYVICTMAFVSTLYLFDMLMIKDYSLLYSFHFFLVQIKGTW